MRDYPKECIENEKFHNTCIFIFGLHIICDECIFCSRNDSENADEAATFTVKQACRLVAITGSITLVPYHFDHAQWGWDNMATILLTTFSDSFSYKKSRALIRITLKFVHHGSNDNTWALVQVMAGCRIGYKPLSEPIMAQFFDANMRHLASIPGMFTSR